MATGTLYTYPENVRAYKALIAAKYSNSNVKEDPNFKYGETNKSDAFLGKFPFGDVPAFEDSKNNVCLYEANAIAYYLATDQLRGKNATDASFVQQWVHLAENRIQQASANWVFPCMGIMQYNKQSTERAKDDVKAILSALNSHLLTRTYLVGERITLADISVCCHLLHLFTWVLDPEFRKPFPNVVRWFLTLVNQPNVKSVVGETKLCEKMAQFDGKPELEVMTSRADDFAAKKFQENQGKSGAKKEKKPAEPKAEKKQEKKKEEKKPEQNEEEDEPVAKPSKDPFASLPKGTMVMDEWKKTYSNEDTKTVALPWLWKNFDKENFSVWYCEYKYPKELTLTFMSCNLISGMFQRLDRMRKHAFGSMVLFGTSNNSTISGVWFWRGHDLAFTLSEDLQIDYESYEWRKLNYDSDECKKLMTEYFQWEGDFGGKSFNQGKIFK